MRNRLVAVLAVVVACVVALPSPALAGYGSSFPHVIDKKEYSVDGEIDNHLHALVTGGDAYMAALALIGVSPLDVENKYFADLKDSEKCPHFCKVAQSMFLVGSWDNVGSWAAPVLYQYEMSDPSSEVWECDVSTYDVKQANAEYEKAVGGFWGSGGGDIPDSGNSTTEEYMSINSYFFAPYSVYRGTPQTQAGTLKIPMSIVNSIKAAASTYNYVLCMAYSTPGSGTAAIGGNGIQVWVAGFDAAPNVSVNTYKTSGGNWTDKAWVHDGTRHLLGTFFITGTLKDATASKWANGGNWPSGVGWRYVTNIMEFTAPKNTDAQYSPSVVPTLINVYEGDTTNLSTNIVNNEVTNTESTTIYNSETNEYTTVNYYTTNNNMDVSAITQRLDSINAKVGQIGNDLNSLFGELNDNLKALFSGLGTTIDNGVTTLRNQLVQVVSWLRLLDSKFNSLLSEVDKLDKSTNDLPNLSTIESYLRDILSKLDSSVPSEGGTDLSSVTVLVDDVEGQLDTIANKIGSLVNGTPSVPKIEPTNAVVTDDEQTIGKQVGQKAEELSKRFPFSLPWDIQFILSLLVREPAAPVFDLPVIGSDDAVCHVDLSDWEPVAVVCRQATKILFALGLALRTRQLVSSWGSSGD